MEQTTWLQPRDRWYNDVESSWNYFLTTWKRKHDGRQHVFEIDAANKTHNLPDYVSFYESLSAKDEVVTVNGIHYDNPMNNYVYLNAEAYLKLLDEGKYLEVTKDIKRFSEVLIHSELWWQQDSLKAYKYHHKWRDIDFFLYWSKMLRKDRRISLKSLGAQLGYPVIQELPFDPQHYLAPKEVHIMRQYNTVHDIGILKWLDAKPFYFYGQQTSFESKIALRYRAIEKHGAPLSCLSWDDVKMGVDYLTRKYKEFKSIDELPKPSWIPGTAIALKDLIHDNVTFTTPALQKLLSDLKTMTVYDTHSIEETVFAFDTVFSFASGGLHNKVTTGEIRPRPGERYYDWDVASEYPSFLAEYNVSPPHLPDWALMIKAERDHRIYLKSIGQGKSDDANYIKLALNGGASGQLNSEHSPFYHPPSFLRMTLNCQLYLLMLCEGLYNIGARIDMANTDGVSFFYGGPQGAISKVWSEWEKTTRLILEEEEMEIVWRYNISNYLARFINGYTKQKGEFFITKPDLTTSFDHLIVPIAVNKYLLEGIPIEQTIKDGNNDIFNYCIYPRMAKKYNAVHGRKVLPQRYNRLFVSNDPEAKPIFKQDIETGKRLAMPGLKSTSVMIINDVHPGNRLVSNYPVNYDWYIARAMDTIRKCTNQVTLF